MASQVIREWSGINTFAPATQTKLFELLGKLKIENVNTLTILVMGKGGVGKSSTVNSLIGERAVSISPFQSEGTRPVMVSRSRAGFTLNVIDTPGLIEGGYINDMALNNIKSFLLNKTIDVLLYVDRLDSYRVDNLDREVVKAITDSLGKAIWNRALVVLTHAQLSPPDGLPYDEFFSKRSEALIRALRLGAGLKKHDMQIEGDARLPQLYDAPSEAMLTPWGLFPSSQTEIHYFVIFYLILSQGSAIPVVLVENSGRCNKNENEEKILPTGTPWISHLVQIITEVALNGSKSIVVDKKLIEGPNPNDRGKILIPIFLAFQYFFAIKPIEWAIRGDIAQESRPSWETRDTSMVSRRF
ncbi:hypothetical protein G4B88_028027 [Cannabis sativa]|uniref:Translocase of chloroplast n=1 Tax=Cannabis sativa TaxID=3483 RepID=A0A7J6I7G8_CANSA|nr:hypothetical protein G4B88_028027 [Cannabis sativa]